MVDRRILRESLCAGSVPYSLTLSHFFADLRDLVLFRYSWKPLLLYLKIQYIIINSFIYVRISVLNNQQKTPRKEGIRFPPGKDINLHRNGKEVKLQIEKKKISSEKNLRSKWKKKEKRDIKEEGKLERKWKKGSKISKQSKRNKEEGGLVPLDLVAEGLESFFKKKEKIERIKKK